MRRENRTRRALAALPALALTLAAGTALAAGQVGEAAAEFDLENLEGGFYTLSQYADSHAVLLSIVGYG
jgi:hypothetical protein